MPKSPPRKRISVVTPSPNIPCHTASSTANTPSTLPRPSTKRRRILSNVSVVSTTDVESSNDQHVSKKPRYSHNAVTSPSNTCHLLPRLQPPDALPSSSVTSPRATTLHDAVISPTTPCHPSPPPPVSPPPAYVAPQCAMQKIVLERLQTRPRPLGQSFLNGALTTTTRDDEATPQAREIALDWILDICVRMRLRMHSFGTCVYILDCMLATHVVVKSNLQLIAAVCLFIATKMEEHDYLSVVDLCFFCHEVPRRHFLDAERFVLNKLHYQVAVQTAIGVVPWLASRALHRMQLQARGSGYASVVERRITRAAEFAVLVGFFDPQVAGLSVAAVSVAAVYVALRALRIDEAVLDEWRYIDGVSEAVVALVRAWTRLWQRSISNRRVVFEFMPTQASLFEERMDALQRLAESEQVMSQSNKHEGSNKAEGGKCASVADDDATVVKDENVSNCSNCANCANCVKCANNAGNANDASDAKYEKVSKVGNEVNEKRVKGEHG